MRNLKDEWSNFIALEGILSNLHLVASTGPQGAYSASDKHCIWQVRVKVSLSAAHTSLELWRSGKATVCIFVCCSVVMFSSFTLQVYNWELWQNLQNLGHSLGHRAAYSGGPQKRGVCYYIQQPLWVMSFLAKCLSYIAIFDILTLQLCFIFM